MTYKIILPITKRSLAKTCLESIDPIIRAHVIEVDNTKNNIGVSRSWNIGVLEVLDNNLDFLIICSQSMVFKDGMRDFIKQIKKGDSGSNTEFGWHLIALSRETLETCGLFDTNFFPAYYEDSDYIRRMEIAGIHQPTGRVHLPFATVSARLHGAALSIKGEGAIPYNYGAVKEYFKKKWGFEPMYDSAARRARLYKYPFNNEDLPLDYFEERTIEELKKEYGL